MIRINSQHQIPHSVVKIVRAFCEDYVRREKSIRDKTVSEDLIESYKNYNQIVKDSLSTIEEGLQKTMLSDIADNRGWFRSEACLIISEGAYYRRKSRCIYEIAKRLNLV